MFRFLRPNQDNNTSQGARKLSKVKKARKLKPENKNSPYAAVRIIPSQTSSCDEAISKSKITFLRSEAPLIPLPFCTNRYNCKCKYQHLNDRRSEPRREADIGLPDRFSGDNRRLRKRDRRIH
jgi:hypothetical protein